MVSGVSDTFTTVCDDSTQSCSPIHDFYSNKDYEFSEQVAETLNPTDSYSPKFSMDNGVEEIEDELFDYYSNMEREMLDELDHTQRKVFRYPINPNLNLC